MSVSRARDVSSEVRDNPSPLPTAAALVPRVSDIEHRWLVTLSPYVRDPHNVIHCVKVWRVLAPTEIRTRDTLV